MEANNAQGHDELGGFSVEPKKDCPHVASHVLPAPAVVDGFSRPFATTWKDCQQRENWICLGCHGVFCSRYVNGHAYAHYQKEGHAISCSFSDLSFWCYECDSYITSGELWPLFSALHRAKFGTAPFEERQVVGQSALESSTAVYSVAFVSRSVNLIRHAVQLVHSSASTESADSSHSGSAKERETSEMDEPDRWWIADLNQSILTNKLLDRVLGCLYGNCLGDAVGLATEFMNKKQIQEVYGDNPVPFPDFKPNMHNSRWTKGDWTDDSDQMILILEMITELGGAVDELLYARKLQRWINRGFPELGDHAGLGLGSTTAQVVYASENLFINDPHAAAKQAWIRLNCDAAPNGAVMRTSVLGILQYNNLDQVIANTIRIAKVTHYDSRCLASCVATTSAIAMMLQGHDVESEAGLQDLIGQAIAHAVKHIDCKHEEEFRQHIKRDASEASLLSLQLDEPTKIGYTLKCVGSGFWGLCASSDFKSMINLLVREGGDADTNGAVCGALWGARYGYSKLPRDWLAAMPNKPWLDRKVVRFLRLLGLVDAGPAVIELSFEERQAAREN